MSEWIVKQNTDGQLEVVGLLVRCENCKKAKTCERYFTNGLKNGYCDRGKADVQGERILSQGRKETRMNEYGYDTHGMKAFTDETFTAEISLSDIPKGTLQAILGGVPIIRCGDCIHFRRIEHTWFGRCGIHHDGTHGRRMTQTVDYCSWAERRTNGNG